MYIYIYIYIFLAIHCAVNVSTVILNIRSIRPAQLCNTTHVFIVCGESLLRSRNATLVHTTEIFLSSATSSWNHSQKKRHFVDGERERHCRAHETVEEQECQLSKCSARIDNELKPSYIRHFFSKRRQVWEASSPTKRCVRFFLSGEETRQN